MWWLSFGHYLFFSFAPIKSGSTQDEIITPRQIVQPSHDIITDHDYCHSSNLNRKMNPASELFCWLAEHLPIYWLPGLMKDFISFSRKESDRPETDAQNSIFWDKAHREIFLCWITAHRSSIAHLLTKQKTAVQNKHKHWHDDLPWDTLRSDAFS